VLAAGFAAVAGWMIVDQYVWAIWKRMSPTMSANPATFFNEPEKIKVWGENVTNISHLVIAG
jgi:hypothetical protein